MDNFQKTIASLLGSKLIAFNKERISRTGDQTSDFVDKELFCSYCWQCLTRYNSGVYRKPEREMTEKSLKIKESLLQTKLK